eukprot:scaffold26288_cov111-Isochrysis_galbana.AAC.4
MVRCGGRLLSRISAGTSSMHCEHVRSRAPVAEPSAVPIAPHPPRRRQSTTAANASARADAPLAASDSERGAPTAPHSNVASMQEARGSSHATPPALLPHAPPSAVLPSALDGSAPPATRSRARAAAAALPSPGASPRGSRTPPASPQQLASALALAETPSLLSSAITVGQLRSQLTPSLCEVLAEHPPPAEAGDLAVQPGTPVGFGTESGAAGCGAARALTVSGNGGGLSPRGGGERASASDGDWGTDQRGCRRTACAALGMGTMVCAGAIARLGCGSLVLKPRPAGMEPPPMRLRCR